MAGDFIVINLQQNGAKFASQLQGFVNSLRVTYSQGKSLKASLNHMHDGIDFTTLEIMCGLQPGQGQIVFDLINGTIGSLEGAFQVDDGKELTERVG